MPAGSHSFQLGTFWCTVLSDGYAAQPSAWCFPNADSAVLAEALTRRGSGVEQIISPYTCLLIETGREVVLADAGLGAVSSTSGAIVARLEMAGIRPQDVNTVIFTHAHPDHIGGAVNVRNPRSPELVFPNARCIMTEVEWDFWTSAYVDLGAMSVSPEVKASLHASAQRALQALRHHLELIDGEKEIIPGIRLIPAPGHTPGHLALLLSSDNQQLLNLGDAALDPLHLQYPEWDNGFDLDPELARHTRRRLLEEASAAEMHIMAFHFPFPSAGRVARRPDGGWEWRPGW